LKYYKLKEERHANRRNKALVLRTRNPNKYSIIPKFAVVGESNGIYEVAIRWGLDEARVLKNLGLARTLQANEASS
jgi:hypothetical protein